MRYLRVTCLFTIFCIFFLTGKPAMAQTETKREKRRHGAIYASWGYNQEWYTKSTVHVKQDALGNEYDMVKVNAHDHMGWNNKSIFKQALTIPQYNYRIGYYFNEKQDMGIELNFDHTKYIITNNQLVHFKGRLNNAPMDSMVKFSEPDGFFYFLNNGANFFLFNFVKRIGLYNKHHVAVDFVGKAGIGPLIPHVENALFGVYNKPHFQVGGWNTGLETAVRVTVAKYVFLEISQKVDYARYSGLKMAGNGTARQAFGTYELILSGGFILPTTKNNPLFVRKK